MAEQADLAKAGITEERITPGAKPPLSKLAGYLPLEVRSQAAKSAAKADEILIRLQRLFTTTANVESFLAPLNYSLYLLVYLQKSVPSRSSSAAAALNDVVGGARNTLRLLQLPVLYNLLRTLLSQTSSARGDLIIWRINVAQCVLYIVYQLLENIAHLIDLGVLSSSSLPIQLYRNQSTLWLHSNRFWHAGITCDLLRLAQEVVVARNAAKVGDKSRQKSAKQQEANARWWNDLTMAGCTWPITMHLSLEHGISRMNDGVIGILGISASWETLRQRWVETRNG